MFIDKFYDRVCEVSPFSLATFSPDLSYLWALAGTCQKAPISDEILCRRLVLFFQSRAIFKFKFCSQMQRAGQPTGTQTLVGFFCSLGLRVSFVFPLPSSSAFLKKTTLSRADGLTCSPPFSSFNFAFSIFLHLQLSERSTRLSAESGLDSVLRRQKKITITLLEMTTGVSLNRPLSHKAFNQIGKIVKNMHLKEGRMFLAILSYKFSDRC